MNTMRQMNRMIVAMVLGGVLGTPLAEAGWEPCHGNCTYKEGRYRESLPVRNHAGETLGRVDIEADSWKESCRRYEQYGDMSVTKIDSRKKTHSVLTETY